MSSSSLSTSIDKALLVLRTRKAVERIGIRELKYSIKSLEDLKRKFKDPKSIRILSIFASESLYLSFNDGSGQYKFSDIESNLFSIIQSLTNLKTVKLELVSAMTSVFEAMVQKILETLPIVERLNILILTNKIDYDFSKIVGDSICDFHALSLKKVIVQIRKTLTFKGPSLGSLFSSLHGCRNIESLQIGSNFKTYDRNTLSLKVCRLLGDLVARQKMLSELTIYVPVCCIERILVDAPLSLTDLVVSVRQNVDYQALGRHLALFKLDSLLLHGIRSSIVTGLPSPLLDTLATHPTIRDLNVAFRNELEVDIEMAIILFLECLQGNLVVEKLTVKVEELSSPEFGEEVEASALPRIAKLLDLNYSLDEVVLIGMPLESIDVLASLIPRFRCTDSGRIKRLFVDSSTSVSRLNNVMADALKVVRMLKVINIPAELIYRTLELMISVDLSTIACNSQQYPEGLWQPIKLFFSYGIGSQSSHSKLSFYSCLRIGQGLLNNQKSHK